MLLEILHLLKQPSYLSNISLINCVFFKVVLLFFVLMCFLFLACLLEVFLTVFFNLFTLWFFEVFFTLRVCFLRRFAVGLTLCLDRFLFIPCFMFSLSTSYFAWSMICCTGDTSLTVTLSSCSVLCEGPTCVINCRRVPRETRHLSAFFLDVCSWHMDYDHSPPGFDNNESISVYLVHTCYPCFRKMGTT